MQLEWEAEQAAMARTRITRKPVCVVLKDECYSIYDGDALTVEVWPFVRRVVCISDEESSLHITPEQSL